MDPKTGKYTTSIEAYGKMIRNFGGAISLVNGGTGSSDYLYCNVYGTNDWLCVCSTGMMGYNVSWGSNQYGQVGTEDQIRACRQANGDSFA